VGERRWFAFLRAINTGNRRLTNEQLLAPFHALGFTDVAAYQAAGNVTFRCSEADVEAGAVDEQRIEAALADAYGFETPTFVRTHAEVHAIVNAPPFSDADLARTTGKVQVAFLRRATSPEMIARVMALVPAADRVVVSEREWWWLPVEGVSTSTLPVGQIENLLGEMTMRTLGTVARMHTKFAG
jgi:uncharacterized protein (DUF1697 family)